MGQCGHFLVFPMYAGFFFFFNFLVFNVMLPKEEKAKKLRENDQLFKSPWNSFQLRGKACNTGGGEGKV